MNQNRKSIVRYRLDMAKATLQDMRLLWEERNGGRRTGDAC